MTPEYRQWLIESFAPAGVVSVRRFFGLDGLYFGQQMFGLVADDRIYLKTDEQSWKEFEREGSAPLVYVARSGERVATSYWEIPQRLYDEPDELVRWAIRAHAIAQNSTSAKRKQARTAKPGGARQPARRRKNA